MDFIRETDKCARVRLLWPDSKAANTTAPICSVMRHAGEGGNHGWGESHESDLSVSLNT